MAQVGLELMADLLPRPPTCEMTLVTTVHDFISQSCYIRMLC